MPLALMLDSITHINIATNVDVKVAWITLTRTAIYSHLKGTVELTHLAKRSEWVYGSRAYAFGSVFFLPVGFAADSDPSRGGPVSAGSI